MILVRKTLVLCCLAVVYAASKDVDQTLELLEWGEENLDYDGLSRAVLVLGESEVDRLTLISFLTKNTSELHVRNENGTLTMSSATRNIWLPIPDVIGEKDFVSFVDFPFIRFTGNLSVDTASAYLYPKLFQTEKHIKFILSIKFSEVNYVDKKELDNLVTKLCYFIKDVDKIKKSVLLVVTGFDNTVSYGDGIKNIMENLVEFRNHLGISEIDIKKAKLINAIITSKQMAIFFKPDKKGEIKKSKVLSENQSFLLTSTQNAEYVRVNRSDLNFTAIPDEIVQFVKDNIFEAAKLRILNMSTIISTQLLDVYKWKARHNTEMQTFLNDLLPLNKLLGQKINLHLSRQGFELALVTCVDEIRKVTPSIIRKSGLLKAFLLFDIIRQKEGINQDMFVEWTRPLVSMQNSLYELQVWYSVFVDAYTEAGKFQTQVKKYSTFGRLLDPNYSVYESGINDFLTKIEAAGLAEPSKIAELQEVSTVYEFIIRDADAIVNLVRPNVTCSGSKMKVHSNFVIMSRDVVAQLCINVNKIEILAMEKLYFDMDLILRERETHVIIIADTWEIVGGGKVLNVEGVPGKNHPSAIAGWDGLAGLPGEPGGSILAIANIVNRADGTITLISNGGVGGDGQQGGNGNDGVNGSEYPPPSDTEYHLYQPDATGNVEASYTNHITNQGYSISQTISKELDCDLRDFTQWGDEYEIKGKTYHTAPTNGLNGGKSGLGGRNGTNTFIDLNQTNSVIQLFRIGENGLPGEGGLPGKSSTSIGIITSRCLLYKEAHNIGDDPLRYNCAEKFKHFKTTYSAYYGSVGTAGIEETPRDPNAFLVDEAIVDFKCLMLRTKFVQPRQEFIGLFSSNDNILNLYTLNTFIAEIKCINSYSGVNRELIKQDYINPLIQKLYGWSGSETDITVANYIRGALTSMIWNVQTVSPNVFVSDLTEYISTTRDKINIIDSTPVFAAAEAVRDDFKSLVNLNIPSSRQYLENYLVNDLIDTMSSLNQTAYENTIATEIQLKESDTNMDNLTVVLKELKNSMRKSMSSAVFRVLSFALNNIPLAGEVASLSDGLISQMYGTSPTEIFDSNNIEGAVSFFSVQIDKYINSKMSSSALYVNLLNYVVDTLADDSPGEIAVLLTEMKDKVNDALSLAQNPNAVALSKNKYHDSRSRNLRQFFNNNSSLTDNVIKEIAWTEENALKLISYEETIYNTVVPILLQMQSDLITFTATGVPIDISTWEVQNEVKNIRNITIGFSESLLAFSWYFSRLDDATDMIITMYGQIEIYEKHNAFVAYISALDLPLVEGTPYDSDVQYLEVCMKQNILTQQTETAEASLMQKIIPLAGNHQDQLGGYYVLQDTDTLTDVKLFCNRQLDYIDNRLLYLKATISESDVNFGFSNFTSNSTDSVPFNIWRHNKYGRQIHDLIYGKETVLDSSVYGTPFKFCVRFSEALINIKASNSTFQNELDSILKSFEVFQTHMGNSMYKYVNRTFIIRSNAVPFVYSIEKDSHGQPVSFNEFYSKAKQGDITLSPHASWKIKLNELEAGSFQKLQNFYVLRQGEIDLELVGQGKFLRDVDTYREDLEDFYPMHSQMFPMFKGYVLPPEGHFNNTTLL